MSIAKAGTERKRNLLSHQCKQGERDRQMDRTIQEDPANSIQSTRQCIINAKKTEKMKSKIHEHQKNNNKEVSKNNLLFDFTVDKSKKTVFVNREFAAELSLVWDAFTKQEILDQWWAPKPWESKTKAMDFKVGGHRFYAMEIGRAHV